MYNIIFIIINENENKEILFNKITYNYVKRKKTHYMTNRLFLFNNNVVHCNICTYQKTGLIYFLKF